MKTIHFWNDTEQVITEDEATKLKQAFDDGREFAEINGHWFKLSAVADIVACGKPEQPLHKQLMEPEPKLGTGYDKWKKARDKLAKDKSINA